MKIYLLRHGTTAWNAGRRIQGRTDIPLDEDGEKLAVLTGEGLKNAGVKFSKVYASPLYRARRTAELVAPGVKMETDSRLLELAFGTFEGREVSGMMADESQPFRFFHEDPARYDEALRELEKTAPDAGYESLTSLCARVKSFLDEIILSLQGRVGVRLPNRIMLRMKQVLYVVTNYRQWGCINCAYTIINKH